MAVEPLVTPQEVIGHLQWNMRLGDEIQAQEMAQILLLYNIRVAKYFAFSVEVVNNFYIVNWLSLSFTLFFE